MYGYIKPLKSELRVREYEHYKATYCGLCHALKEKYGFVSRFLVNYDFTLLAIVLEAMKPEGCEYVKKRCIASPHKKKCVCKKNNALDFTADATVILAYFKAKDNIADKSFFKSIPSRILKLFCGRAYKNAKKALPWFNDAVAESIANLNRMEQAKEESIDAVADTFGTLMASLSAYFDDEAMKRIAREIFYHMGRVIYIVDALFDMEEDVRDKNYNPLVLNKMSHEEVITTINCSLNTAISDWELVDENTSSDLVLNVLSLGIPAVIKEKEKNSNE